MPTVAHEPPGTVTRCGQSASYRSIRRSPAPTRTVRRAASQLDAAQPADVYHQTVVHERVALVAVAAAPGAQLGHGFPAPIWTAWATSPALAQKTTAAGKREMRAFWSWRAVS